MTEYNDVPQVSALHAEQERVAAAISMLEQGGTIPSFVVGPAPPPTITPMAPPPMMMPVTIMVPNMISDALRIALLDTLYARQADLVQQLADLGVTDMRIVNR